MKKKNDFFGKKLKDSKLDTVKYRLPDNKKLAKLREELQMLEAKRSKILEEIQRLEETQDVAQKPVTVGATLVRKSAPKIIEEIKKKPLISPKPEEPITEEPEESDYYSSDDSDDYYDQSYYDDSDDYYGDDY